MGKKKNTEIRDLYKGDYLDVWANENGIFFSLPGFTFNVQHGEEFNVLLEDLDKFVHSLRPHIDEGWIDNLLKNSEEEVGKE